MKLSIFTLGVSRIEVDGTPLSNLPSRAAEALLIHLACLPHPVSRDTLATLLWEGRTQQNARGNLRTILSGLRKTLGNYLIVTRNSVAFNHAAEYRLDCAEFEKLLAEYQTTDNVNILQQAINLYRGDFLAGFSLRDGLGFEEWAVQEQNRLQRLALDGLRKLVAHHIRHSDISAAITLLERLLTLDPYDESARRQLMLAHFRLGERNTALKDYQTYRKQLQQDMDIEPESATQALYRRLADTPSPPPNNLPTPSDKFVGRAAEQSRIRRLLLRPDTQLVSILGPGGIGKTSLSLQAVRHLLETHPGQFINGTVFVPLVNVKDASLISYKIESTLDLKLQSIEYSEQRLSNFLRDKEMLLILDNFEHLISDESVRWLSDLLAAAPKVKILLTSRERLNLRQEHVIDLRGLPYPPGNSVQNAKEFSAVKLFLQHANRVRHKFEPADDEMADIVRLCQMVDGMPLAIELAAAETRYFPCRHIVTEIEKQLDFASTPPRNRPPRHASLRATIEYSWTLLTESDPITHVARRLAVFRGAFDLPAAVAITNATPHQLVSLVDRSFLQRTKSGLFEIHPLIQQFLAEKLAEDLVDATEANSRHADWYTALAKKAGGHEHKNTARHFSEMKQTVETHFDNIVAAALYLARHHHFPERRLAILIESLIFYFEYSHRYREWKTVFNQITHALRENSDESYEAHWMTLVLSSRIAQADISLHAYHRAEEQLHAMMPEVYALQNDALISACLHMLSFTSARAGNFDTALKYAEDALAAVSVHADHFRWPVLRTMGDIALDAGDFARAEAAHAQAFTLAENSQSAAEARAIYKLTLGKIARRNGNLAEAQHSLSEGLAAARTTGKPDTIIYCLMELGYTLAEQRKFSAAKNRLAEAESLNEQLGDVRLAGILAMANGRLADIRGHTDAATQAYHRAATIFSNIDERVNLQRAQNALAQLSEQ